MTSNLEHHCPETKVLLVEDDHELADEVCEALTTHGLEVRMVSNAEDALPLLLDWQPKFLLCDLHLPGLSGDRLTNLVSSLDYNVLIILMSADQHALQKVDAANTNLPLMSISKPLDMPNLLTCLGAPITSE